MKKVFFLLLFLLFFSCKVMAEEKWDTFKSTHFIVFYKNATENSVKQISDRAEEYYDLIADNLGFKRFDFWLWDDRAKIYIHDDIKAYQSATGQPSWSVGVAYPSLKTIQTFPHAGNFLDTVLLHEMGHIIFREFVGFNNPGVTLWLDEGVASYQEKTKYSSVNILIRKAIDENNFMDLNKLFGLHSLFGLDSKLVYLFYAESFSLVDFLIKEFGRDRFVLFCQELRDKKNFERALTSAYPYANVNEFGQAWQGYLK